MRNRSIITGLCLSLGALAFSGVAFAHGTEKHGRSAAADAQMKKLHDMMPMFSVASAGLEAALDKGDVASMETEAGKIMAAIPDLKKTKPHKNSKQRATYVAMATDLGEAVTSTVDLAKRGNLAGAKAAYKKAEKACSACHAKFRD